MQMNSFKCGVDTILKHYLSSNNLSPLSTQKLQQVNNILALKKINPPNTDDNSDISTPILRISSTDTLLQANFSTNIANAIIIFIFNKTVVSILAVVLAF